MLKQTPLHSEHEAAGAKLIDFGGWEMPLHYGSQIEEHHAVRNAVGIFDVSHMLALDVAGSGARDFLRYALANNVDKLTVPGRALYSCMLNERGGVIDDLIVYYLREHYYRLVVNASTAESDLAWLQGLRAQRKGDVELTPRRDLAILAVQGPRARETVWTALPGCQATSEWLRPFHAVPFEDILIARTGYTGEDGFELMTPIARAVAVWKALLAAQARPCGLGARDTLRMEAGMNLYGQDMDQSVTPLESGLSWTVDLSGDRDFVGSDALREEAPSYQLTGLVLREIGGVLRAQQTIRTPHGEGKVTSGGFSPTLGRSIALARLPNAIALGAIVRVAVRDKELNAEVVKLPFVRNGKALVSL